MAGASRSECRGDRRRTRATRSSSPASPAIPSRKWTFPTSASLYRGGGTRETPRVSLPRTKPPIRSPACPARCPRTASISAMGGTSRCATWKWDSRRRTCGRGSSCTTSPEVPFDHVRAAARRRARRSPCSKDVRGLSGRDNPRPARCRPDAAGEMTPRQSTLGGILEDYRGYESAVLPVASARMAAAAGRADRHWAVVAGRRSSRLRRRRRQPRRAGPVLRPRARVRTPPDDARIMMRWWWFGPTVTKRASSASSLMKDGGIGGVNPAGVPCRARRSLRDR